MINILREFYLGNISPTEQLEIESLDFNKKNKKSCELEESLMSKLNPDEKAMYEEIMLLRMGSSSEEVTQSFIEGFTLGALFLMEVTERSKRYVEN